ncbi:MAG: hypothetical protein UFN18_07570 [Ruminococcus sp.]|nr:hypothetical protein [Ruminococcus sp.]MEE0241309.1 hypothetical protein [Ruminococcus sp.]
MNAASVTAQVQQKRMSSMATTTIAWRNSTRSIRNKSNSKPIGSPSRQAERNSVVCSCTVK